MERKKTADQTPNNDKKQALDTAIRQIEKNFGKGAVMRLGDRPDRWVAMSRFPGRMWSRTHFADSRSRTGLPFQ